jgi:hypothetical protein
VPGHFPQSQPQRFRLFRPRILFQYAFALLAALMLRSMISAQETTISDEFEFQRTSLTSGERLMAQWSR